MELIDGLFWGFEPVDGFDIEPWNISNSYVKLGNEEYRNAKIFKVEDNTPYADELYVFDQCYRFEKQCPFDDRIFPEDILENVRYDEDFDWEAIHFAKRIYCGGRIDLCGGNSLRGIVPAYLDFIISAEMKDNILENNVNGFSFYDITVNPNQTQIENIRLFGINADTILIYPYESDLSDLFENISPSCPVCGCQPLFCCNCKRYFSSCPQCGTYVFKYDYFPPSPSQPQDVESIYRVIDHCGRELTIIAGERWNGEDIFIPRGSGHFSYMVTKRFIDFMERNQYGPMIAIPFQVDVSRCTKEQKDRIKALRN
jgi:hypothetical protein